MEESAYHATPRTVVLRPAGKPVAPGMQPISLRPEGQPMPPTSHFAPGAVGPVAYPVAPHGGVAYQVPYGGGVAYPVYPAGHRAHPVASYSQLVVPDDSYAAQSRKISPVSASFPTHPSLARSGLPGSPPAAGVPVAYPTYPISPMSGASLPASSVMRQSPKGAVPSQSPKGAPASSAAGTSPRTGAVSTSSPSKSKSRAAPDEETSPRNSSGYSPRDMPGRRVAIDDTIGSGGGVNEVQRKSRWD